MSQLDSYLAWCGAHVGWGYNNKGPWRCTGEFHTFDCSGFACGGVNAVVGNNPPPGWPRGLCADTDFLANWLIQNGRTCTREVARATPGTWAIRIKTNTLIPGDGHMVVSAGIINGVARTFEAHSTADGVIMGYFDGNRDFTVFGFPPLTGFGSTSQPVVIGKGVSVGWKIVHHPKSTNKKPGYWCVDDAGHVYSYGIASYHGGQGFQMPDKSVVNLNGQCDDFSITPSGNGYLMITSVGSIYAFGDAKKVGDPHGDPAT